MAWWKQQVRSIDIHLFRICMCRYGNPVPTVCHGFIRIIQPTTELMLEIKRAPTALVNSKVDAVYTVYELYCMPCDGHKEMLFHLAEIGLCVVTFEKGAPPSYLMKFLNFRGG